MATVVTYQHAYITGRISLCERHAATPPSWVPVLGPVEHGAHEGRCEACYDDMSYEYSWATGDIWEPVAGATEQEAADVLASLVGGTCPVPGAYRPGRERAKRRSDGSWVMPTGAVIRLRRR